MPNREKIFHQVIELNKPEDLLPIRAEWSALVRADPANSIFQTWEWVYYHLLYGDPRHKPFILTVRDSSQKLAGVCPLRLRKTSLFKLIPLSILEFVGSGDSDYLEILAEPDDREAVFKTIVEWLVASNLWHLVDLRSLRKPDTIRNYLKDKSGKSKLQSKRLTDDICPYLVLDPDWNSVQDGLSGSLKKYLKRKTNKLTKDKTWRIQTVADAKDMDAVVPDFMNLHNQRLREKSILGFFEDATQKKIFSQITKAFAEKGWVRLITMTIDNKMAAALYTFLFNGKLYYYQGGIDPQYRKYSLGYLMHLHAVETAWKSNVAEYDFLKGDEDYKRQWTGKTRKVHRLIIYSNSIYRILYNLWFLTERILLGPWVQKLYLRYRTTRMPAAKQGTADIETDGR